jgi:hypothetical protein
MTSSSAYAMGNLGHDGSYASTAMMTTRLTTRSAPPLESPK